MSGERCSVWEDPEVIAAMRVGRQLNDISVLNCPRCGQLSYYNNGSHFYCRHCDKGFEVLSEDEPDPGGPAIRLWIDTHLTMDDVLDADYP